MQYMWVVVVIIIQLYLLYSPLQCAMIPNVYTSNTDVGCCCDNNTIVLFFIHLLNDPLNLFLQLRQNQQTYTALL